MDGRTAEAWVMLNLQLQAGSPHASTCNLLEGAPPAKQHWGRGQAGQAGAQGWQLT